MLTVCLTRFKVSTCTFVYNDVYFSSHCRKFSLLARLCVCKVIASPFSVVFLFQEQQIQKLKNEKIKIAMMKLKEASVQKVSLQAVYV